MWRRGRIPNIRRLVPLTLLPCAALLLAAGCGGGDKTPTDPTGPTGPTGNTVQFSLVALGRMGLPADAELEDCKLTRFYSGDIALDANTGDWQIVLQVHDDSGDWGYQDHGTAEVDGADVWFDSDMSGASYRGTVSGSDVTIMYDWCFNGVPDVQLVFAR
jgi:hypothetical protein